MLLSERIQRNNGYYMNDDIFYATTLKGRLERCKKYNIIPDDNRIKNHCRISVINLYEMLQKHLIEDFNIRFSEHKDKIILYVKINEYIEFSEEQTINIKTK